MLVNLLNVSFIFLQTVGYISKFPHIRIHPSQQDITEYYLGWRHHSLIAEREHMLRYTIPLDLFACKQ